MIQKIELDTSIVKCCNDFEAFVDLMDEAKYSVKEIYFNRKKHDKRRTNFEDFEDIFNNNIPVKYSYTKNRLNILIGDCYTQV